jgi:hypothetical protein
MGFTNVSHQGAQVGYRIGVQPISRTLASVLRFQRYPVSISLDVRGEYSTPFLGTRLSMVPHGLEAPPPTPSHHKLADPTY